MAQPVNEPQVVDSERLSVRDGPYGRCTVTTVAWYDNDDVLLTRVNGDNAQVGELRLQCEQVRPLCGGPARLHGTVYVLEARPGHTRREAWCEGDTIHIVLLDKDRHVIDDFRLFGDEVTPFLTFVWHHLAQTLVA